MAAARAACSAAPGAIAGPLIVLEQRFRIVDPVPRQGAHQARMQGPGVVDGQVCGQRLTQAVVIQLDVRGRAAVSQEMVGTEDGDQRPFVAGQSGRLVHHLWPHRSGAEGEHVQEAPGAIRRAVQAVLHHVGERRVPPAAGLMPRGVMRQLLHQEGIAARLARQREPLCRADRRRGGNQGRHDVPCFLWRHRIERQRGPGRRSLALQKRLQERLGGDLFRPQAGQQQERRGIGRAQQRVEHEHAVGVGPVQVIDVEHERVSLCDPRQEVTERRERQAALRGRVRLLHRRTAARARSP